MSVQRLSQAELLWRSHDTILDGPGRPRRPDRLLVTDAACEDYADYICECHADEYDCNEVRLEVSDPDADQLADCQVELDDLQADDADAGLDCAPAE